MADLAPHARTTALNPALLLLAWLEQVERHVVTHRTGDLPGVSPLVMGRPHRHSYLMASVVDSPQFFSPSQVRCMHALVHAVHVHVRVYVRRSSCPARYAACTRCTHTQVHVHGYARTVKRAPHTQP